MSGKIKLMLVFSPFLLTMCRAYAAPVSTIDGLSCRTYTDYLQEGFNTSRGVECTYTCPDGTVAGPLEFETDPSLSATEGDLDRLFCGIAPATFTPMEPAVNTSPTPDMSSTPAASPTPVESPTAQASATAAIPLTAQEPLLTGQVTMCDIGGSLISFRIVETPPDLAGKTVTLQIAEQESTCYVNATNPSLMTCTLPPDASFPASVVVSVDGTVVNEFSYDGRGCARITTPIPTTTP